MVPIAEHDWADIDVVLDLRGTVDNHRSSKTSGILSAVVRMIPGCTIKIREERVGETFPRRNRALLNSWNTIEPGGLLLQDAVPMQCSALFRAHNVVAHIYGDGVTPVGFDQGGRECSVDKKSAFVHSIRSNCASGNVEVVRGTPSCREI